jgi:hypothetical protein
LSSLLESVCTTVGQDWQRSMLADEPLSCLRPICGVRVDLRMYLLFTFFSSTFLLQQTLAKGVTPRSREALAATALGFTPKMGGTGFLRTSVSSC